MYTASKDPPEEETPAVEILLGVSRRGGRVRGATLLPRYVLRQEFLAPTVTYRRPTYTACNKTATKNVEHC